MKFKAHVIKGSVISEENNRAHSIFDKNAMGSVIEQGVLEFNYFEALYLFEKEKLDIYKDKKKLSKTALIKLFSKQKNFFRDYKVFYDLRSKGHKVKSGLKYGAAFRVYKKGVKPGKGHSEWICVPVDETKKFSWSDFSAYNRVAHSTKKKVLIAVVQDEDSVVYYQTNWIKP